MEIHPMEEQSHLTPVSAPISRTSPTDSGEILQQLVQALMLLGCAPPASTPPAPPSTPATCIRSPDTFDGSNLDDLQPFLLQCQLTFNSYPQHYASDSSKVFFTISYLKKSMLEWFEIRVMESDPRLALTWHASWPEFLSKIHTHFGPSNPTRTAEIELCHLSMQYDSTHWPLKYIGGMQPYDSSSTTACQSDSRRKSQFLENLNPLGRW